MESHHFVPQECSAPAVTDSVCGGVGAPEGSRLRHDPALDVCLAVFDATGMGNSNSDRSSGGQGDRSYRDGQPGGKEARANILMDSTEDGDLFQREDSKV